MNENLEMAKAISTLNAIIVCTRTEPDADILGSLLTLADQLERLDAAIND